MAIRFNLKLLATFPFDLLKLFCCDVCNVHQRDLQKLHKRQSLEKLTLITTLSKRGRTILDIIILGVCTPELSVRDEHSSI